ncbi:MAG: hypothetical protein ABIL09_23995 [Gemmatimonadota bacterium]
MGAALHECEACLAALGHGRPIRQALKLTDEQLAALQARLGTLLDVEEKLTAGIMEQWDERAERAAAALDDVLRAAGDDVDAVVAALGEEFSGIGDACRPIVERQVKVAYDTERVAALRSGGINEAASFLVVDAEAKAWLVEDTTYWIGSAYDRVIGKRVASVVSDVVIEQGLGHAAAARELMRRLPPELVGERPRSYFEIVSNAAATRGRTFGAVASFEQANVAEVVYVNPMDQRTSDVCRELDGRVYTVEVLSGVRDRMLAADSPEAAKEIMPWVPASDLRGKTTSALEEQGAILPPAHARCRSVLDIFIAEGTVTQVAGPDSTPEAREAWGAYTAPELGNKAKPLVSNPQALTASLDAELSQAQIEAGRRAVAARDAVVGTWPDAQAGRRWGFWDRGAGVRAELDDAGLLWSVEEVGAGNVAARIAADRRAGVALTLEGL